MRHTKNIRLDEIQEADKLNMPDVAKNAYAFSVAEFCKYNRISGADRDELARYGVKKHLLLPRYDKKE